MFKYVRQLRHDRIDDSGPCVLLATPSMLQVPPSPSSHSPTLGLAAAKQMVRHCRLFHVLKCLCRFQSTMPGWG